MIKWGEYMQNERGRLQRMSVEILATTKEGWNLSWGKKRRRTLFSRRRRTIIVSLSMGTKRNRYKLVGLRERKRTFSVSKRERGENVRGGGGKKNILGG